MVFARQQLGTGAIKSVDPERGKEVAALSYEHRVSIQTRKAVERLPAKQVCHLRPLVNNSSECINRSHSDVDAQQPFCSAAVWKTAAGAIKLEFRLTIQSGAK